MRRGALFVLVVVALALLAYALRPGSPETGPGVVVLRDEGEESPRSGVARWFPLRDGRRWVYAVSGDPEGETRVEYRCRHVEGSVFSVYRHTGSSEGPGYEDIGELRAGPGDAWRYSKGWQRTGKRWVFLPEDPVPGERWEVRPGLEAEVLARSEDQGGSTSLVVRYERMPQEPAPAGARPEWLRTRWFERGVGVVREEGPGEGDRERVMTLVGGEPEDP